MRISDNDIAKAEQMDLLTYLQIYEPGNLKRVAGNEYRTIDHDSLRISNGKWHWYSKGIGEIGSVLEIKKLQNEKRELMEALEMFYRVVFLGEEFDYDEA